MQFVQSGEYEEAARAFRAAEAAGLRSGALYFNLGVACFRSGNLEAARRAFLAATGYPSMAAPAYYNLGRMARDAGNEPAARRMFQQAADTARTTTLRQNALAAVADLRAAAPTRTSGRAELGMGYDSNPPLTPGGASAVRDRAATFAYSTVTLRQPFGDSSELFGQAYAEHYVERDDFDLEQLRGGWSDAFSAGQWDGRSRVEAQYIHFGGATFEYGVSLAGDAWRDLGPGLWTRLSGSVSAWRGGPDYEFLDGSGWDASAVLGGTNGFGHQWQVEIGTGIEDRRDADAGADFFSYSSRAAHIGGTYSRGIAPATRLSLAGQIEWHDFGGTEIRDGAVLGARDDRTTDIRLRLLHELSARWALTGDATWSRRESDVDEYDYRRMAISGGLRVTF